MKNFIETVKNLLSRHSIKHTKMRIDLNEKFVAACGNGDLDEVKRLLTSPDLKLHANIENDGGLGFVDACNSGHLHIVQYLLTSPELNKHVDIHFHNDMGIIEACKNGHLEIVQYLLSSPDLTEHADIHCRGDKPLINACWSGQLDVVKYLLTSPELAVHANIHNEEASKGVFINNHLSLAKYLIFDYNMPLTDTIKEYLPNHPEINEMFTVRDNAVKEQTLLNGLLPEIAETTTKKRKI